MKISELSEFELIDRIASRFAGIVPDGCLSIGDDCAVIPLDQDRSMVVTTDMLVEGVHFLWQAISAYELGRKALAVNLSDVAGMGATAHSTFLSIALPGDLEAEWVEQFADGYRSWGVPLMGGDTTCSGVEISRDGAASIVINITVIGTALNTNLKYRSGAHVGDIVMVTGPLGDSGAGLRALLEHKTAQYPELVARHHNPEPMIEAGVWLGAQPHVGAMMDISDGVASDLLHILRASSAKYHSTTPTSPASQVTFGAEIDLDSIPLSNELLRALAAEPQWDGLSLALAGGEDYQLLLTCPPDSVAAISNEYSRTFAGRLLYPIGTITEDHGGEISYFRSSDPSASPDFAPRGYNHFKK